MSWAEELCELYDKNKDCVGKMMYKTYKSARGEEQIPYVLLPPFHTTVTAQITVTLDEEGNFLEAEAVEQDDKLTIIPVTEKSQSRTAGIEPHPFCDNLKYVAGDYKWYTNEKTGEAYEKYMQALADWNASPFTHKKVHAVYIYLKKACLIHDLLQVNVLKTEEEEILSETEKIQGIPQNKAFVRFKILQIVSESDDILTDKSGKYYTECWKDLTLQESFIEYYREISIGREMCYLSGNTEQITYLHPKKIRNEGDGAKLISANDAENFTFLGRFQTREQAFAVGSETSQKVHNALKWIIRKQGRNFETLCVAVWESNLLKMPCWDSDTEEICKGYEDSWDDEEEDVDSQSLPDTNAFGAERFYAAMNGYGQQLEGISKMVLMAFDAATTGRLALAEYKSLESTRYLDRIKDWHTQCGWLHYKKKSGISFVGMLGIKEIADILYGVESKGALVIADKNRKRMYAEVCKRLIPCIWDGGRLPSDLVYLAVGRASSPVSFKERYNWEKVLSLACSLVKKHRYDRNPQEVWTMALDTECKKRDYLYGRLLALADRIEYRTFEKEKDSSRMTNAKRYMAVFSKRPFETWKIIEEGIQPYLNKLKTPERLKYQKQLDEICDMFDVDTFMDNSVLDGLYLLGFHSQSQAMKKENTNKDEEAAE